MKHALARRLGAFGLTVGLLVALPGAAYAREDDTRSDATDQVSALDRRDEAIGNAKARALEAIERRLDTLSRLSEALERNPHLTGEHHDCKSM